MKRLALLLALALPLWVSCSKTELEFLKGEPLALYVNGQKYSSTLTVGTNSIFNFAFDIAGGTSNKHSVSIADPSIASYSYIEPGTTHWNGSNYVSFAQLIINPKALGMTTLTITDTESGEKANYILEVRKSNYVFPVVKSDVSDFPEETFLWFTKDASDPKIYIMGDSDAIFAVWNYKFIDVVSGGISDNGMFLRMEKVAGLLGQPIPDEEKVTKEWRVLFNENGSLVSGENAILTLFNDLKVIDTKADEVYQYILMDPENSNTMVTLDLPIEGYLNL